MEKAHQQSIARRREMENGNNSSKCGSRSEFSTKKSPIRVQRDVEFLRKEHSLMLNGLYDEIEKLQRQCKDMQFRLICHGILPSKEDMLKERLDVVERELAEKSVECDVLRADLAESRTAIDNLEERIQSQEMRYQDDVSARNLIIARLRKEIQEKTSIITKLAKLLRSHTAAKTANGNVGGDELSAITTGSLPCLVISDGGKQASATAVTASQRRTTADSIRKRLKNLSQKSAQSLPTSLAQQLVDKYCRTAAATAAASSSSVCSQNGNVELASPSAEGAAVAAAKSQSPHRNQVRQQLRLHPGRSAHFADGNLAIDRMPWPKHLTTNPCKEEASTL